MKTTTELTLLLYSKPSKLILPEIIRLKVATFILVNTIVIGIAATTVAAHAGQCDTCLDTKAWVDQNAVTCDNLGKRWYACPSCLTPRDNQLLQKCGREQQRVKFCYYKCIGPDGCWKADRKHETGYVTETLTEHQMRAYNLPQTRFTVYFDAARDFDAEWFARKLANTPPHKRDWNYFFWKIDGEWYWQRGEAPYLCGGSGP